jgi:hypothetical protein
MLADPNEHLYVDIVWVKTLYHNEWEGGKGGSGWSLRSRGGREKWTTDER